MNILAQDEKRLLRLLSYYHRQNTLCTDGIIHLDEQQQIILATPFAQAIFGEPAPNANLITWTGHEQLVEIVEQAQQSRLEIIQQFNYQNHIFELKAKAVEVDEQFVGTVLVLRDVSELQRLGRARREFVANISHDLRTPITNIRLISETLLNGDLKDVERAQTLVQKILAEIDTLSHINDELLDLALIESGRMPLKLTTLDLTRLVRSQVERLNPQARRKGLKLSVKIPEAMYVLADEGMVGRILTNLIYNSIKFTEIGQIIINAKYRAIEDVVCVSVADTGIGIDKKYHQRIFERFFKKDSARSRETGTGLGLAIARHIVVGHGGKIWVESELEQGATFYFTLPAA